jgi:hypothetical protein
VNVAADLIRLLIHSTNVLVVAIVAVVVRLARRGVVTRLTNTTMAHRVGCAKDGLKQASKTPLRKLFALIVIGRVWITISLLLSSSAGTVIHGNIIIA